MSWIMHILNHFGIFSPCGRLYFSKDNCNNNSHLTRSSTKWPAPSPSPGGISLPSNLCGLWIALASGVWWEWCYGSEQVTQRLPCLLECLHLEPWGRHAVRKPNHVDGPHVGALVSGPALQAISAQVPIMGVKQPPEDSSLQPLNHPQFF